MTPLSNPVVSDSAGKFVDFYFDSTIAYRGILRAAGGATTSPSHFLSALPPADQSSSSGAGAGATPVSRPYSSILR